MCRHYAYILLFTFITYPTWITLKVLVTSPSLTPRKWQSQYWHLCRVHLRLSCFSATPCLLMQEKHTMEDVRVCVKSQSLKNSSALEHELSLLGQRPSPSRFTGGPFKEQVCSKVTNASQPVPGEKPSEEVAQSQMWKSVHRDKMLGSTGGHPDSITPTLSPPRNEKKSLEMYFWLFCNPRSLKPKL